MIPILDYDVQHDMESEDIFMNQQAENGIREMNHVRTIAMVGILTALVYVFTAFVNIRLPFAGNGGLIHLGNVPLFLGAVIYGKKTGAIAGGVGMGLFDITSGWLPWAPFTIVIAGLMGYVVGMIAEKKRGIGWYAIAIALACVIKIVGYYIAEVILYGNWIAPFGSVPGNLLQILSAAILVLPIAERVRKAIDKIR